MEGYSLLMSVYVRDEPDWLRQSVRSIIDQTVPPSEYVIVKDGPLTDELEAVLAEEFCSVLSAVKYVPLERNQGLAQALRHGVEACTFELIARMDADDVADLTRMEKQLAEFERDPSLGVIGSVVLEFEDTVENVIAKVSLPTSHDEIVAYAKRRCPCRHPTLVFRRTTVLRAGNYSADMTLFEDWDLYNRMIRTGAKCMNLQSPLVYVRVTDAFYGRRGGFDYLRRALRFRKREFDVGFSSLPDFVIGSLAHSCVCLLPASARTFIYRSLLRS